ncbi:2-hydroxyacyl-CoA dehydratase subunit D, partial [Thermodesulfobacteriota bacterium]
IESQYLGHMVDQLKQFIAFLEGVSGQKVDWGRVREAVALSNRLSELFYEIQDLRRVVPCPIGGTDIMSLIGPIFIWAGSERGIDIYEQALEEAREKVSRKEGVVPEEKFRLFFESIPPWYSLGLFNYMQARGGVSVIETYSFEFAYDQLDPDYPLESLAKKQLTILYNYSVRERGDLTLRLIKDYQADGYVHWNIICCKQFAHFATYMRERCERELDIPGMILDADQADIRDYNEGIVKGRIDAFFELLGNKKYGEI